MFEGQTPLLVHNKSPSGFVENENLTLGTNAWQRNKRLLGVLVVFVSMQ